MIVIIYALLGLGFVVELYQLAMALRVARHMSSSGFKDAVVDEHRAVVASNPIRAELVVEISETEIERKMAQFDEEYQLVGRR